MLGCIRPAAHNQASQFSCMEWEKYHRLRICGPLMASGEEKVFKKDGAPGKLPTIPQMVPHLSVYEQY